MKIYALAAALVTASVVAFSPQPLQRFATRSLAVVAETDDDTNTVGAPTSSDAISIENTKVGGVLQETQQEKTTIATSTMEQFVSDIRLLYSDLENGGGSIKVRRDDVGVSFTHVAPAYLSTSAAHHETNKQMNGEWRMQSPTIYNEATVDWNEIHSRIDAHSNDKAPPMLIYLPGLDCCGISGTSQFDDLSNTFEFWRMTVDKSIKQPTFAALVSAVVKFVKDSTNDANLNTPREIILVGESFGGLLTCAVAMALNNTKSKKFILKGMTLVNPATSFDETNWEQFVPLLTSLRYLETQEDIVDDSGNFNFVNKLPTPYSVLGGVALAATVPDSKQYSGILDFILGNVGTASNEEMLAASGEGFRLLAEYLPAKALEERVLKWLPVGSSVVNNVERLSLLDVPTLIIAGNDDNMLPTKEEANRLGKLLPDCVKMDVSGSGHFVLDERVNLTEVLLDSHIDPLDIQKNSPPYDPVRDWKLPPDHVVRAVIEKRVKPTRERASPVFFSTDSTGQRRRGVSQVPSNDRPLLIVGNHQLFGQDLGMIISELLEQRNIVPRGLAHPTVAEGLLRGEQEVRSQRRRYEFGEDLRFEGDLFQMFGAVKVSPRNFFRLLQTNQTALLFPGGVREALHGKGEDYKLFWPEKTDFVRVAARFNATIVPLSAIGAADSATIIADANELVNLPFGWGENLSNFSNSIAAARFDAKDNEEETFIPPLALPKPLPARHYFLFGRSFDTSLVDPSNKDACDEVYKEIKSDVQQGIDALLEARKDDPYAFDGLKRSSYQRFYGKDPPTFPLSSLSKSSNRNQ